MHFTEDDRLAGQSKDPHEEVPCLHYCEERLVDRADSKRREEAPFAGSEPGGDAARLRAVVPEIVIDECPTRS